MLNDITIAIITILFLASVFVSAFCHDCIVVRRHRSDQREINKSKKYEETAGS